MHAAPARLLLLLAAIAVATLNAGCKSRGGELEAIGSPERVHQDALKDLRNNNYASAIQRLEALEARYPFSPPAKQGQLDLLYAYYKNHETESAIDQADQFIRENPTHPRVDYAYYIRGLVYFEAGANWLERTFRADMAKRPPQEGRSSLQSFQVLVQQYPKSPYAADARQRMIYLRNRLADYELEVAKYYLKRGAYVGAINRSRGLIQEYDGAPAVPGALKVMAQSYRKLGMDDLAQVAEAVRTENKNLPDLANPAAAGMAASAAVASAGGAAPAPGMTTSATSAATLTGSEFRRGRWEARAGAAMSNSADVDFEGGTTADIDGGVGFMLGVAYHYTDHLQFGSTFTYDQKDYDAEIVRTDDDGEPIDTAAASGSLDAMTLMFDVAYNILTGPLTPFVAGSVGWTWVDTNIIDAPPDIGCWWDPWYGYICVSSQNTKSIDGFAYELGVGVRYDFSDVFALDGGYKMRWIDFENATGTPSFDGFQVNLGWKF
jgi:outer membrane protein assembly factor BamD